jgi:hypothetical protein
VVAFVASVTVWWISVWGYVPLYRRVGIAAIVALTPIALVAPLLVLLASVTAVLVAVAAWDTFASAKLPAETRHA